MPADAFSKYIKIEVDPAAWRVLMERFKELGLAVDQISKKSARITVVQKEAFASGAQAANQQTASIQKVNAALAIQNRLLNQKAAAETKAFASTKPGQTALQQLLRQQTQKPTIPGLLPQAEDSGQIYAQRQKALEEVFEKTVAYEQLFDESEQKVKSWSRESKNAFGNVAAAQQMATEKWLKGDKAIGTSIKKQTTQLKEQTKATNVQAAVDEKLVVSKRRLASELQKLKSLNMGLDKIMTSGNYAASAEAKRIKNDLVLADELKDAAKTDRLRFDEYRVDIQRAEENLDGFVKTQRESSKSQSILNSNIGKFSIIMSGIAATLFVWQELLQLIRWMAAPALDAEKAWSQLYTQVQGTREELVEIYNQSLDLDIAGAMNIKEATSQIADLRKQGFSLAEAYDYIKIKSDALIESESGLQKWGRQLSRDMRAIARLFTTNPTEEPKPQPPTSQRFLPFAGLGQEFPYAFGRKPPKLKVPVEPEVVYRFMGKTYDKAHLRDALEATILFDRGYAALEKAIQLTGLTPKIQALFDAREIRNQLEGLASIISRNNPIFKAFELELTTADWKKSVAPLNEAWKDIYDKLGIYSDEFYVNELLGLKLYINHLNRLLGPDAKIYTEMLEARQAFNLKMKQLSANVLLVPPDAIKRMEKFFRETGFMSSELIKQRQLEIQINELRTREFGSEREKEYISATRAIQELQLFKDRNKARIDIEEDYYKETRHFSQELYDYRLELINREIDILRKKGLDEETAQRISIGRTRQLERERLLTTESPSAGAEAYLIKLDRQSETVAQEWERRWTTTIQGTKQSVDTFFFSFFQSETKSLMDSLEAFGNAFKQMVDRMASDLISSGIMQALFGKAYNANVGGGLGLLGGGLLSGFQAIFGGGTPVTTPTSSISTQIARRQHGGAVTAGRPVFVGEAGMELFIPNKSGMIAPISSGQNVSVETIVINNTGQPATKKETRGPDNLRRTIITIGAQDIISGGSTAKAIEQVYGIKRQGRIS